MKGINPISLTLYVILSFVANIGFLWPGIFKAINNGGKAGEQC